MARARRVQQEESRRLALGLTHKVRNALNAMRTYIALLQRQAAGGEGGAGDRLNKLEEAVGQLELIIGEFQSLASPQEGAEAELSLESVVREVAEFLALDLAQGRIVVEEEFRSRLPLVLANRDRLKRVVLDLINNARQAMAEGGVLTLRLEAPRRGQVLLEVADTGCGIAEECRARVFEPFYSTKPGGLGLGLAAAKRTAEDLGGRISFDSQPGQGTTFRLLLPSAQRRRATLERKALRRQWLQPAGQGQ